MTKTRAIRRARSWVSIVNQGNQYVVQKWAPDMNATWVSHPMDWWHARNYAREEMLEVALEAMGIEDAGEKANGFTFDYEGRWTDRLTDILAKQATQQE
jgi:hypothetical protein